MAAVLKFLIILPLNFCFVKSVGRWRPWQQPVRLPLPPLPSETGSRPHLTTTAALTHSNGQGVRGSGVAHAPHSVLRHGRVEAAPPAFIVPLDMNPPPPPRLAPGLENILKQTVQSSDRHSPVWTAAVGLCEKRLSPLSCTRTLQIVFTLHSALQILLLAPS